MAESTIHGIEFEIKGNANSAADSLNKLAASLSKIKNITNSGLGFGAMAKEIRSFNNVMKNTDLTKVALFVAALKKIGSVRISGRFARGLSNIGTALGGIKAGNITKITNALSAFSSLAGKDTDSTSIASVRSELEAIAGLDFSNLDKAADGIRAISESSGALQNAAQYKLGDPSHQWAKDMVGQVEYQDKGAIANLREVMDTSGIERFYGAAKRLWESFKNILTSAKPASDAIKKVSESSEKAAKSASKAAPPMSKLGNALKSTLKNAVSNSGIKRFADGISNIGRSLGRIAMYRIFRSMIKAVTQALQEGTKNLYQYSKAVGTSFAQNMDRAATSMQYFKNSIAAAWSPLMGVLAPALDAIVDKVIAVINAVNQLIAILSGASGWTRAIKQATEYEEAVGGAGGAAKKALEYLAPFDELNVLPDPKSGGGGGGSDDYGGMFEEMESFEEGIAGFAAKIKEAIENSDWQGLGTMLGEKINEIIENIDFASAGAWVGEKINAWFTTKYWTLDSINFVNIGAKIAEFLNNALSNIDFEILGRSFVQKFTNIFDIAIGFVENLDFGTLATSISDWILGALKEATEWIKETDWATLMDSIVNGIVDFIENLQVGEILVAVGDLFVAISGAILDLGVALVKDLIDVFKNPDTWSLLWTWFEDYVLRGFVQFGINLVNALGDTVTEGLNALIAAWNNSSFVDFIREQLGWDWTVDPIEFKLIADLDPPVGELYKQKKEEIEAASASSPVGLNMQGVLDDIQKDALTSAQKTIPVTGKYKYVNKDGLTSLQRTIPTISEYKWSNKDLLTEQQREINTIADYKWSDKSDLSSSQKTINTTAAYEWVNKAALTVAQKTIGVTGKYKDTDFSALTYADREIDTTGKYTDVVKTALDSAQKTLDVTANVAGKTISSSIQDEWGRISIDATAVIRGTTGETITLNSSGGVFQNGAWSRIPQYASGGRVGGSLFVAGEAGPELVGHVGGRTEVLNRSQLAATMYAAVRNAMTGIAFRMSGISANDTEADDQRDEDIMYRAITRALADSDLGGDVNLDGNALYRAMVTRNRQNTRLTGVNAMA